MHQRVCFLFSFYKLFKLLFKILYRSLYDSVFLANKIKTLSYGQSALQRVAFARNYLDKQILNICFDIGNLSSDVMLELGTTSNTLKLSADNLIKNFITHSDVCFDDYCKIPQIAQNPTKFTKSKNGLDIILFKNKKNIIN